MRISLFDDVSGKCFFLFSFFLKNAVFGAISCAPVSVAAEGSMPGGGVRKKAIKKAFEIQQQKLGLSIVEVLSSCPTNWGLTPEKALEWLRTNMMQHYRLGVFKDVTSYDEEDE